MNDLCSYQISSVYSIFDEDNVESSKVSEKFHYNFFRNFAMLLVDKDRSSGHGQRVAVGPAIGIPGS